MRSLNILFKPILLSPYLSFLKHVLNPYISLVIVCFKFSPKLMIITKTFNNLLHNKTRSLTCIFQNTNIQFFKQKFTNEMYVTKKENTKYKIKRKLNY